MTFADFLYPVIWWPLLLAADSWNYKRHGLSLWRGDGRHFLLITAPVSVLLWLFFEVLNLPAPQWRYRGGITSVEVQVLFGFVAFATVVPIMVESWWLVAGRHCSPDELFDWLRNRRGLSLTVAAVLAVIPSINDVFWLNQGMWLIPALVLLPRVRVPYCPATQAAKALAISALLAGFMWEAINYLAATRWEYLILPDVPHLFHMPVPGYIGFIPFAASVLAVYQWQCEIRARLFTGGLLWTIALAGLYILSPIYVARGLWVFT